jgi:tetratricopeptide (TPR) repeat protein
MNYLDPLSPDLYERLLYEGWDELRRGDNAAASMVFNHSAKLAMKEFPAKRDVKARMLTDCALGLFVAGFAYRSETIELLQAALDALDGEESRFLQRGRVHRQLGAAYESMEMWSEAAQHLRKAKKLFEQVCEPEEKLEPAALEDLEALCTKHESKISPSLLFEMTGVTAPSSL